MGKRPQPQKRQPVPQKQHALTNRPRPTTTISTTPPVTTTATPTFSIKKVLGWIGITILIPLIIGLAVLLVQVLIERPSVQVLDTGMPKRDVMVFYQAVMQHKMTYTNDKWNVHINDFPPYDDANPVFGMGDLPALDIPITLINSGRKATTLNTFQLTMYSDEPLSSRPGVIIDETGKPASNQSVFLDIGQEQKVTVRFEWLNLDSTLRKPSYQGMQWDHPIEFRGLLNLVVTDVEGRQSSMLIETGRARVEDTRFLIWWVTLTPGKGSVHFESDFSYKADIATNPYMTQAFLQAGIANYNHNCFQCALSYLDHLLTVDSANVDGHYYRGLTHKRLGNVEQAKQDFQECVSLGQKEECTTELSKL